jgi:hypothetical protein
MGVSRGYHRPSGWWQGDSPDEIRAVRWSSDRGVLALVVEQVILLLLFLLQLGFINDALVGGVIVPVVRVRGLKEVVTVAEETSQSPRIIEPREIGVIPATAGFVESAFEAILELWRSSEMDCRCWFGNPVDGSPAGGGATRLATWRS